MSPSYTVICAFLGLITFTYNLFTVSSLENKLLNALQNQDYVFIEKTIDSNLVDVNIKIKGKTLLIYACIYDKPEMVLLLLNKGALLNMPCDFGFTPEEHAVLNNSIYALAQIIIVKA